MDRLRIQVQQRRGGRRQLVPRNERVAVGLVEGQLKEDPRLHPALIVGLHLQLQGKGVHHGKIRAEIGLGQHIGIIPQGVHRQLAVGPVQPHGQLRRQMVGREEFDETPHAHLAAEALGDLPGLGLGNPRQLGQLLRLVLQDVQTVASKGRHNPLGRLLPHALHGPGGQVCQDFLRRLRHEPLQQLRFELAAIGGMGGPASGDGQPLPHHGHGDGSHHRHQLAVLRPQPQDRVAVLLILKDNRRYGSVEHFLFHGIRLHFHDWVYGTPICGVFQIVSFMRSM